MHQIAKCFLSINSLKKMGSSIIRMKCTLLPLTKLYVLYGIVLQIDNVILFTALALLNFIFIQLIGYNKFFVYIPRKKQNGYVSDENLFTGNISFMFT